MAITPEMISEKNFRTQMRGYHMEEVDDFLDYITEEVEHLLEENNNLQLQIEELVKKVQAGGQGGADPQELENLRRQLDAARMRVSTLEKAAAEAQAVPAGEPVVVADEAVLAELEAAKARIAELTLENRELRAAVADADAAREEAVKEAREMVGSASVRVNAIVSDAEQRARKALAALQVDIDDTKAEYERLRADIQQTRATYSSFLQSQMRAFGFVAEEDK